MKVPRNMIGPQLRQIRLERELTQPALALMCQLKGWDASRDIVARIEGQTRWVSDIELVFLANVLGVDLLQLFPGPNPVKVAKELLPRLKRASE